MKTAKNAAVATRERPVPTVREPALNVMREFSAVNVTDARNALQLVYNAVSAMNVTIISAKAVLPAQTVTQVQAVRIVIKPACHATLRYSVRNAISARNM